MSDSPITPPDDSTVAKAFRDYHEQTKAYIRSRLQEGSPDFFEKVVVDLMLAMKFGRSGEVVGKSGDGGIDGIVYDDQHRLGFERIYVQAKRWSNPVGRPEVQAFAGALQGISAKKGVLITTSRFTADAREYVRTLPIVIVLIDGFQLAELMYETNVGVTTISVFELKRLDESYFKE